MIDLFTAVGNECRNTMTFKKSDIISHNDIFFPKHNSILKKNTLHIAGRGFVKWKHGNISVNTTVPKMLQLWTRYVETTTKHVSDNIRTLFESVVFWPLGPPGRRCGTATQRSHGHLYPQVKLTLLIYTLEFQQQLIVWRLGHHRKFRGRIISSVRWTQCLEALRRPCGSKHYSN